MSTMLRFILLIFLPVCVSGQMGLPFTENFTKSDYKGENQVWSISQASDHAIAFANNRYFLRYDGVAWERANLPAQTPIRSLYVKGERIYSGSYKEFGFWTRRNGQLFYTSLSSGKNLFLGASANEEIWKIFEFGGLMYFQSFNELFIYNGQSVRKKRLPFLVSYFYEIDGKMFAASVRDGLFQFDGDDFVAVPGGDRLKGEVIHGMQSVNGKTFVFTKSAGIFEETASGFKSWNHPLNDHFRKEVILCASFLKNNQLAVGTSQNGLYLINLTDGSYRHLNRLNSLLNNTVLSIFADREGDLWLGLDNGIAHVEVQSPVGIYSDTSGELGTVYAVAGNKDGLLLGSNHGLFEWNRNNLNQVEGSQGQVWNITAAQNQFLIGHNDGFFSYTDGNLKKVNGVNGGWKLFRESRSERYFQASYTGIATYPSIRELSQPKYISGLTKPIRDAVQESSGVVWASDNYKGLYRILLGGGNRKDSVVNVTENQGLIHDYGVRLITIDGRAYFLIQRRWFEYDAGQQKLLPSEFLNRALTGVQDIFQCSGAEYLANRGDILYRVTYSGSGFQWEVIPPKYYSGKLVSGNTAAFALGDRTFVNLDDGFLVLGDKGPPESGIRLEGYASGSMISEPVAFGQAVELHVISDRFGYGKPVVYYRVDGEGLFQPVREGKIMLNNLGGGAHTIEVYRFDGNQYQQAGKYEFRMRFPWYFSNVMIVVYLMSLLVIAYVYYRWNKLRTDQRLKLQAEELRHQNQIAQLALHAENDERRRAYEKQILELEVRSKTGEIAGKSLSIAKQSEMIDTVLSIVETEEDSSRLKSKIRKAIRGNELNRQEWEAFENNLNQINEGFTTRLLERFPGLSPKEIKLCIHLRMNLSSKEIAPLMNISYRGVELQRYRLRKKLGVPTDTNLNQLMMGL